MSAAKPVLAALGAVTLAAVWLGPLPRLAVHDFSAHMAMHMSVMAVAAPLLAFGGSASRYDPVCRWPRVFSAVPASLAELVVVWAWHAPVLHAVARGSTLGLVVEQGSIAGVGWLVWASALGGSPTDRRRAGEGVIALLLTTMHMTLLGALLALAPRAMYSHRIQGDLLGLDQQHLGGAIMLIVGGAAYLAGGLFLSARLLRQDQASVAPGAKGLETAWDGHQTKV